MLSSAKFKGSNGKSAISQTVQNGVVSVQSDLRVPFQVEVKPTINYSIAFLEMLISCKIFTILASASYAMKNALSTMDI